MKKFFLFLFSLLFISAIVIGVILFKDGYGKTILILKSGTMIAQTSPKLDSVQKSDMLQIYTMLLVDGLGLSDAILPVI